MRTRRLLLLAHLLLVLAGAGYLVLSLTGGSTPDANIGAGLAVLWLQTLGTPWSWLLVASVPTGTFPAVALTALLNLVLHGVLSASADRVRPRYVRLSRA